MPGSYRAKYESCQFTEISRWGSNMTRAQEHGIRTRHLWVKPWRGGWGLGGSEEEAFKANLIVFPTVLYSVHS